MFTLMRFIALRRWIEILGMFFRYVMFLNPLMNHSVEKKMNLHDEKISFMFTIVAK